jgi:serine/threonine protein phosphatase 1
MPARTIAIGDIHGCSQALETLLATIQPQHDDLVVTLGDYVNRGPDSRGVIEQLIRLGKRCTRTPILGNHDEMLLQLLLDFRGGRSPLIASWLQMGGDTTLVSYGATPDTITHADLARVPPEHLAFLKCCRDYLETQTHIFVHALYESGTSMVEQSPYHLRWGSLKTITPEPHVSGKRAIVGHSSQKTGEILDLGYLVCIDTFCYASGWLTAFDVDSNNIWQVNKDGFARLL